MLTRACLSLLLLMATPVLSQAVPSATVSTDIPEDEYRMPIPPMVSGIAYPTVTRPEERANYLKAGFTFEPAYYDNLLPGEGTAPISDIGYSMRPSIALDLLTPRLHQSWTYSPGFTLYQRTSARNDVDQNASLQLQYRLTQHMTISGQDNFSKTSNVFNQSDSLLGEPISGSPPSSPADVIIPFADRLTNVANAVATYQFGINQMIGIGGTTSIYNFPDQAQFPGGYDSNSRGGSAFYTHRMYGTQFIGVIYQYIETLGHPPSGQIEIQTNAIFPFYTASLLQSRLSLSLAGGPQHYDLTASALPPANSWTPAVMTSLAWQGDRTAIVAMYSRTVTGAGGLIGVYNSTRAGTSARWHFARTWSGELGVQYLLYKNLTPEALSSTPGGHSFSLTASIDDQVTEHFGAKFGYGRLDEDYSSIAAISSDPNSDRWFISISYQFLRPLGR